jgi:hypothetical protein
MQTLSAHHPKIDTKYSRHAFLRDFYCICNVRALQRPSHITVGTLFLYLKPDSMKKILKTGSFLAMLLMAAFVYGQDKNPEFDRREFYKAMQVDKMDLVDAELSQIKTASIKGKDAFEGALTMKKAGLSSGPIKKLKIFKSGHKKLENAIQKDSANLEFRFLRLMIQENAPGILGYKKEMDKDSELIRKGYKNLPEPVQHAVLNYNKKSKVLKLQDS